MSHQITFEIFGQAPLLFSGAMECDCQTFEQ